MSRPFLISEVLSVFIQETKPSLLSTRESKEIDFSREMIDYLPFDRVPSMSKRELVARVQMWIDFCTAICFDTNFLLKCA